MRIGLGIGLNFGGGSGAAVDVSGAVGEYNFDVANVTKDGSSRIATLNDISGNVRHLTQGTDANKPVWTDDTADYGSFDAGGAAALKRVTRTGMAATFAHYEWTILMVSKCITAPNVNNQFNIFGTSDSGTGREGCGQVGYYSTPRTRRCVLLTAAGASSNITFGGAPADTWEVIVLRIAGTSNGGAATCKVLVNEADTAITGTTTSNNIAANGAFFLGSSITNGNCAVKYVKAWNRALNDASMVAASAAANASFGVY